MSRIGLLGCGKIGSMLLEDLQQSGKHQITFIQDPFCGEKGQWNFAAYPCSYCCRGIFVQYALGGKGEIQLPILYGDVSDGGDGVSEAVLCSQQCL